MRFNLETMPHCKRGHGMTMYIFISLVPEPQAVVRWSIQ